MSDQKIRARVPEFIRSIEPYRPGKPVEEVERELNIHAIKLASNENPLGPSPLAVEAIRKFLSSLHRYPDGGGYYLRQKLAARLGVELERIFLGNGTCEVIDLCARVLLHCPDDEALTCTGSFPLYYTSVRATGARLVALPLRDYTFDLPAIAAAISPRTRVVILANPNNPTGTHFTADAFDAFLARVPAEVLVVLDEAYYEYVERKDYSRSIALVRAGRNLLVLRTFSKVYGLAGLRIGYGVGPEDLLAQMNKIRAPFNTASISQVAALAALDDAAHVARSVEMNRAGLEQLAQGLARLGVKFVPSVANFVFVEFASDAEARADDLLKLGVIVRPLAWMGFSNAVRVTVGSREENDKFLQALAQICAASSDGAAAPLSGPPPQRTR
jgi:histidinol-phosphate aminotransferase